VTNTLSIEITPYTVVAQIADDGTAEFSFYNGGPNPITKLQLATSTTPVAPAEEAPTAPPPTREATAAKAAGSAARRPAKKPKPATARGSGAVRVRKPRNGRPPAHVWLRNHVRSLPDQWGVTQDIVAAGVETGYTASSIRQAKNAAGCQSDDTEIAGKPVRIWRLNKPAAA
jgi:hypothetical protein